MRTIKGPGIFLAQFIGGQSPFNTTDGLAQWAAGLGYKAIQMPCNHASLFDVEQAAVSQTYCDDIRGMLAQHGLTISELSTHLEGQLVAVHPTYDDAFDGFAPQAVRGNSQARQVWATRTLHQPRQPRKTGVDGARHVFRIAGVALFLPPPPHNAQRFAEAFQELADRWRPILDGFDEQGLMSVLKFIPAKICTMASRSSVFLRWWIIIRAAICSTIPAICCCSRWTISDSSTPITRA